MTQRASTSSGKPRAGLRLMHVHAHPDDESSKGAASTAKYVAEGVDVHVATCTGGERGSIVNPKMDRPEILENITEIRRQEMERARDILGIRQDWLGFVDSGWPEGDPKPPLPEGCFALVPLEEAIAPLVRLIAQQYSFEPQCIVVPAEVPVTFRGTATDAIHGFIVGRTNANTMLVPGFVATFTTSFHKTGEQLMPCHEYCGTGHEAMWARVQVLPREEFLARARPGERMNCVPR